MPHINFIYCLLVSFLWPPLSIGAQQVLPFKSEGKALVKNLRGSAQHCIRNTDGNLVIVGSIDSGGSKGLGLRFLIIHPDSFFKTNSENGILIDRTIACGDEVKERTDANGDYVANSICQTLDGGYIIAGYASSKQPDSMGKHLALLIKTDEKGEHLWSKIFGLPQDNILIEKPNKTKNGLPRDKLFTDVVEDEMSDLWLCGVKNDSIWLVKTDSAGQMKEHYTFGEGKSGANALTLLPNKGGVALTGFVTKAKKPRLVVMAFDNKGANIWKNQLKTVSCGKDILKSAKGELYIAGTEYSRRRLDDALLVKMDTSIGKTRQTHTYGGKSLGDDGANTLVEDFKGHVFLGGYTKSYPVGSRRQQFFWVETDSAGKELQQWYQNLPQNGFVEKGVLTDDGSLFTVGSKDDKAWIHHLGQVSAPPKPLQTIKLEVDDRQFVDDDDGSLTPKELRYYAFRVKNISASPLYQAQIKVKRVNDKGHNILFDSSSIRIGRLLAGEERRVSIPFRIQKPENIDVDGTAVFEVSLKGSDDTIVIAPKWQFNMPYRKTAQVKPIVTYRFLKQADKTNVYVLNIEIENPTDFDVNPLYIRFDLPQKAKPLKEEQLNQRVSLLNHQKRSLLFDFAIDPDFSDTTITVKCSMYDKDGDVDVKENCVYSIKD